MEKLEEKIKMLGFFVDCFFALELAFVKSGEKRA